jgi:hypothetical protein
MYYTVSRSLLIDYGSTKGARYRGAASFAIAIAIAIAIIHGH